MIAQAVWRFAAAAFHAAQYPPLPEAASLPPKNHAYCACIFLAINWQYPRSLYKQGRYPHACLGPKSGSCPMNDFAQILLFTTGTRQDHRSTKYSVHPIGHNECDGGFVSLQLENSFSRRNA